MLYTLPEAYFLGRSIHVTIVPIGCQTTEIYAITADNFDNGNKTAYMAPYGRAKKWGRAKSYKSLDTGVLIFFRPSLSFKKLVSSV